MGGVLVGFSIIGFVILIGYFVERFSIVGEGAGWVLNRMAFFVATPALLFTVLSHADVSVLFSEFLVVIVSTIVVGVLFYLLAARLFFRTPVAEAVLGASSATYVNANNIGLPVAIYVLGSAQYVAPVLLLQLVILAPTILAVLDITTRGRASFVSILTQPIRNPMIVASLAGVLVAIFEIQLPATVLAPFELIGGAAIPLVLLSFGMSLHGQRLLRAGTGRKQVLAATVIKVVLMPIIAYVFGAFVFHLQGAELFAVVAVSALPTAQNIFNFASRYDRAIVVTRDTVLLTTITSMPALLVIAALLA
ncbi:AEC family transporter [Cryobacterium sp. PH29-G1]|uniref:AEC family transporter n=1 Tax=Cryobacterium sp. PH29-G1 TaxID=3046211 RepID=UPI0024B93A20|nr:AEC family transporter [Cryobacterium sp. PH29-G1]MDJ0350271.1 AEC family transporter [Cryobacterium sp. PH29-G1]